MRVSKGGLNVDALEDMTSETLHDWVVAFDRLIEDENTARKNA
jgi:hypothetical protein